MLQLPKHLSNFSIDNRVNEYKCNSWFYSLGCKLIRVGWIKHFWLLKNTHFVFLEALAIMWVVSTINNFLIIPNIVL